MYIVFALYASPAGWSTARSGAARPREKHSDADRYLGSVAGGSTRNTSSSVWAALLGTCDARVLALSRAGFVQKVGKAAPLARAERCGPPNKLGAVPSIGAKG